MLVWLMLTNPISLTLGDFDPIDIRVNLERGLIVIGIITCMIMMVIQLPLMVVN